MIVSLVIYVGIPALTQRCVPWGPVLSRVTFVGATAARASRPRFWRAVLAWPAAAGVSLAGILARRPGIGVVLMARYSPAARYPVGCVARRGGLDRSAGYCQSHVEPTDGKTHSRFMPPPSRRRYVRRPRGRSSPRKTECAWTRTADAEIVDLQAARALSEQQRAEAIGIPMTRQETSDA
jgi:hypothetical protein